ncbi:MAG TPA: hypothetical protein VF145_04265, partial [Chitinophagaceae bacterium]
MPRLLYVFCFFLSTALHAQVTVQGRVFDISRRTPLESVVVFTSSGGGTLTDSLGGYTIRVNPSDTIWFSYLGKNTNRFAVADIPNLQNFEISIHVIANELPAVTVRNRNYYLDSIQNRKDYAKAFNYRKPGLRLATSSEYTPGGVGVAFDLEELINFFRFKRNRQLASLQQRLIQ